MMNEQRNRKHRGRKRRSNSDSELVLTNYYERYFSNASPDGKYCLSPTIGINSSTIDDVCASDSQLFGAHSTMDPSQMFMSQKTESTQDLIVQSHLNDVSASHVTLVSEQQIKVGTSSGELFNPLHHNHLIVAPNIAIISAPGDLAEPEDTCVTARINRSWITLKEDKDDLKERGVKWKTGAWSSEEEAILQTNINDYCEVHKIKDPLVMIFSTPRENRKEFYRSIATGLNRPLFSVYRKVLRIFDPKNHMGKYSQDEVDELLRLCQVHGNDWITIGQKLGRSPGSVRDKARLYKANKRKGKWDDKELKLLSKAIHKITNTKTGESVTSGINWKRVAEEVQTRTQKQCRGKWLYSLNWKECGSKEWGKTDDIQLIKSVNDSNVSEETQLDWTKLSENMSSVRSAEWLRHRWWHIKRNVPKQSSFAGRLFYEMIKLERCNI